MNAHVAEEENTSPVEVRLSDIDARLRIIERLVWTAVGGTVVIAALAVTGISLVIKQGERIDSVAIRQAGAIAERLANESALKARTNDLQAQIDRLRDGHR